MKKITDEKELEKEVERQFNLLKFGTTEITPEHEFKKMLKDSLSTGTPLRVKCGIDPTIPDIHLGHLVPYRKMRQFQDLGHTGVVIIGDYTAQIGDPTGKNESRPSLTTEKVQENAKHYMKQVYTVLDPEKTEIRHQSEWFNTTTLIDLMKWAGETTVAKLLGHETFSERLDGGNSLGLHELFYPVLQGMDSVFIDADVELGGSDQRFNVLMGRDYQKHREKKQQVAILLPIVTGLDGKLKMSKSLNNFIAVNDEPFDKFGKVMSIPDNLMGEYFQYIAQTSEEECTGIKSRLEAGEYHPNIAKKDLAQKVVALFHGEDTAVKMREQFEQVFKKKQTPDEIEEFKFERGEILANILVSAGLLGSNGEVKRMVKQGAVSIVDGDKVSNHALAIDDSFSGKIIKVGKRKFLRLV